MAHCTNSLHCGSRLTSSLEKAVRCSSLSSPEGPQVVAEPVLRTIGEIGVRLYINHVRG